MGLPADKTSYSSKLREGDKCSGARVEKSRAPALLIRVTVL